MGVPLSTHIRADIILHGTVFGFAYNYTNYTSLNIQQHELRTYRGVEWRGRRGAARMPSLGGKRDDVTQTAVLHSAQNIP